MSTVGAELAEMRATLTAITGDLDALLRQAEVEETEPEPVEEEESWHAC